MCFPKDDFIRHLRKMKCSQRQIENELETIRRAISAKNVFRVATGGASDTKSGEPPSTTRTTPSTTRKPNS